MATRNGSIQPPQIELPSWRKYDWKINMENYEEQEPLFEDIRTSSSEDELRIWQVHNGAVEEVPRSKHFKFHNNRAYIVLSIKNVKNAEGQTTRNCHLHIWVSKFCSGEDYQLAVVRAEQLEKKLQVHIKAFVHREIELHETDVFHNHAPDSVLEIIRSERNEGESPNHHLLQFRVEQTAHGFNAVKSNSSDETKAKRLKRKWMIERMCVRGNLSSDDVFVLKNYGDFRIFQWNGENSNDDEQKMAEAFIKQEQMSFNKKLSHVKVTEGRNDKDHYLYSLILKIQNQMKPGSFDSTVLKVPQKSKAALTKKGSNDTSVTGNEKRKKLYRLTDESGNFMTEAEFVSDRTISKNNLKSDFVYLLDTDYIAYVWIGEDWTCPETNQLRLNLIMEYADRLLISIYEGKVYEASSKWKFNQPVNKPVTLVDENDHYVPLNKLLRD